MWVDPKGRKGGCETVVRWKVWGAGLESVGGLEEARGPEGEGDEGDTVGILGSQRLWGQHLEWGRLGAMVCESLGNLSSEMVEEVWVSRVWIWALCAKLKNLEWEELRERGFAF